MTPFGIFKSVRKPLRWKFEGGGGRTLQVITPLAMNDSLIYMIARDACVFTVTHLMRSHAPGMSRQLLAEILEAIKVGSDIKQTVVPLNRNDLVRLRPCDVRSNVFGSTENLVMVMHQLVSDGCLRDMLWDRFDEEVTLPPLETVLLTAVQQEWTRCNPPVPAVLAVPADHLTVHVDNKCVICMDRVAAFGFLHGESVHQCVCSECADRVMSSTRKCPLCREPALQKLRVYSLQ